MSLRNEVGEVFLQRRVVVIRPSQVYTAAAPATYNLFCIVAPVEIIDLGAIVTEAADGLTEITTTINTIAGEFAAVDCSGAIGTVIWIPLNNVAGAVIINAAAIPKVVVANQGSNCCVNILTLA
ncbi:unnamed protein product [marine sediment metagenome]|uniref:Uncharacterized protein n=1 Tax=marine sediment metagenome TaxID=412755 RepID=X1SU08_9ZZZZ